MVQPVAIIAGAGRGIGRATAAELHRRGFRLALSSRTAAELNETAARTEGALVLPGDVGSPEHAAALVRQTLDRFGRIDAVVNAAGYAPMKPIEQTTDEDWRAVLDANLSSAFYLSRAAWPTFRQQKSGVVVNLSSLSARDPFPGLAAYGAAKAGLNTLGWALAREGAPIGVRIHTLGLGATETRMFRALVTEEQYPKEKTMDPAEVAQVIAACVTGELRYASGEVVWLQKLG